MNSSISSLNRHLTCSSSSRDSPSTALTADTRLASMSVVDAVTLNILQGRPATALQQHNYSNMASSGSSRQDLLNALETALFLVSDVCDSTSSWSTTTTCCAEMCACAKGCHDKPQQQQALQEARQ